MRTSFNVYLASPFFSPKQRELLDSLREKLLNLDLSVYSPMHDGEILSKNPSSPERIHVFESNTEAINSSDIVVAIIDDRDMGVIWEIGYAYAKGKPIITYTNEKYGLNVMIAQCVIAHVNDMSILESILNELSCRKETERLFREKLPMYKGEVE